MKERISIEKFEGKRISIIGCGKSGIEAALALLKCRARVFVSEIAEIKEEYKNILIENNIEFEEKGHTKKVLNSDLIIVSPGVKPNIEILQKAREQRIEILSELEVGYQLTIGKYIAVTGTNGKSTVTELTFSLMKDFDNQVYIAGNIGDPLSMYAFNHGIFVLEVSSFQLKMIKEFKPDMATILNIDQDHMDWHADFEDYVKSKARIFENQDEKDLLILNYDDPVVRPLKNQARSRVIFVSLEEKVPEGAYFDKGSGWVILREQGKETYLFHAEDLKIKGLHNVFNATVSSLFALNFGIPVDVIRERLKNFKGLPHRIEFVLEKNGVKFYDDSKGTNPHAVEWALKGFKEPIILIMGGEDKDLDFKPLINTVKSHCKHIIAIGKAKPKIVATFSPYVPVSEARDMKEAVERSYELAEPGDVVLLSPGCASFDMFKNYKERGDVFQYWVRKIAKEN
uniref:UDP-N-acetylmuramoylalanine--D-glutamate ligase n=1 Tax=candidate division WOR-3 bacterium TaxID=2052148 RepID=A0A7C2PK28_UNCW3